MSIVLETQFSVCMGCDESKAELSKDCAMLVEEIDRCITSTKRDDPSFIFFEFVFDKPNDISILKELRVLLPFFLNVNFGDVASAFLATGVTLCL